MWVKGLFNNYISQIKKVRISLFLTLLVISLLPIIYSLFKGYLHFESDHLVSLHHNLIWAMVAFEIVSETLLFPLYYLFGTSKDNPKEMQNRIITGLLLVVVTHVVLAIIIGVLVNPLITANVVEPSLAKVIINYIYLEIIALILMAISQFLFIALVINTKNKVLLVYLFVQLAIMVIFDFVFVSHNGLVNLSYNGIAINKILVSISGIIISLIVLNRKYSLKTYHKERLSFSWFKTYYHLAEHAFIDAVLLNLVNVLFLIRFTHDVEGYFNLDSFFGLYVLLPVIILGNTLKIDLASSDIHHQHQQVKQKVQAYNYLNLTFVVILTLLFVLYRPSIDYLTGLHLLKDETIMDEIYLLLPLFGLVYLIKGAQNIYDSAFYGLGELGYLTKIAIITTLSIYLPFFFVFYFKLINPTPLAVLLVVLVAVSLDAFLTITFYQKMLKSYQDGKTAHH